MRRYGTRLVSRCLYVLPQPLGTTRPRKATASGTGGAGTKGDPVRIPERQTLAAAAAPLSTKRRRRNRWRTPACRSPPSRRPALPRGLPPSGATSRPFQPASPHSPGRSPRGPSRGLPASRPSPAPARRPRRRTRGGRRSWTVRPRSSPGPRGGRSRRRPRLFVASSGVWKDAHIELTRLFASMGRCLFREDEILAACIEGPRGRSWHSVPGRSGTGWRRDPRPR